MEQIDPCQHSVGAIQVETFYRKSNILSVLETIVGGYKFMVSAEIHVWTDDKLVVSRFVKHETTNLKIICRFCMHSNDLNIDLLLSEKSCCTHKVQLITFKLSSSTSLLLCSESYRKSSIIISSSATKILLISSMLENKLPELCCCWIWG